MKTYGIWDAKDKMWLGTDDGPRVYTAQKINGQTVSAKFLAGAAAMIIARQMREPSLLRFRAKQLPPGPYRHRDNIEMKVSAIQAMEELGI